MPVARLALAGALAAAFALTGCAQPAPANDNPNPLSEDRPVVQPTIIRTPVAVPDDLATERPLPGPTGGPQGEPQQGTSFSPSPDGGEQGSTERD